MVGLWLGLGASVSFIADCRQGSPGDRLPVAGYGYTAFMIRIYLGAGDRQRVGTSFVRVLGVRRRPEGAGCPVQLVAGASTVRLDATVRRGHSDAVAMSDLEREFHAADCQRCRRLDRSQHIRHQF